VGAVSPAARERVPFDEVLITAHQQEGRRLQRYRRRWVAQHVAVLAAGVAVLAVCAPTLFGSDDDLAPPSRAIVFLTGGWLGYLALMASLSGAVLAIGFAVGRIVGVLRTDDLGAYEQTHAPWWADRAR